MRLLAGDEADELRVAFLASLAIFPLAGSAFSMIRLMFAIGTSAIATLEAALVHHKSTSSNKKKKQRERERERERGTRGGFGFCE